ncbi:MAG: hypothetical protein MPL62_09660 [Alphaproteobacteria bacterium]|nr:hypothetical protein [Alphaproteobacteria bacterium]
MVSVAGVDTRGGIGGDDGREGAAVVVVLVEEDEDFEGAAFVVVFVEADDFDEADFDEADFDGAVLAAAFVVVFVVVLDEADFVFLPSVSVTDYASSPSAPLSSPDRERRTSSSSRRRRDNAPSFRRTCT